MSTLDGYAYPVDLLSQFNETELGELKLAFESSGWSAHTWGVDSHDVIEFTLLRKDESDDSNLFVSLYIGFGDDGGVRYSVETLSQRGGESIGATVDSGVMRELTAGELEGLLARGIRGNAAPASDLTTPMLAAIGAVQLTLNSVSLIVSNLALRTGGAVRDVEVKLEDGQARWSGFQEELPGQLVQLRAALSPEELRNAAEAYVDQAQNVYERLVERGEAALERIRDQMAIEGDAGIEPPRAAPEVVRKTALGERAAKLVGVELPKSAAYRIPAAKKSPMKRVVTKKVAGRKLPSGQMKTVRHGNTRAVKRDR